MGPLPGITNRSSKSAPEPVDRWPNPNRPPSPRWLRQLSHDHPPYGQWHSADGLHDMHDDGKNPQGRVAQQGKLSHVESILSICCVGAVGSCHLPESAGRRLRMPGSLELAISWEQRVKLLKSAIMVTLRGVPELLPIMMQRAQNHVRAARHPTIWQLGTRRGPSSVSSGESVSFPCSSLNTALGPPSPGSIRRRLLLLASGLQAISQLVFDLGKSLWILPCSAPFISHLRGSTARLHIWWSAMQKVATYQ